MKLRYYFFLLLCTITISGCAVSRQYEQADNDSRRVAFHRPDADGRFGYATIQTSVITLTDSKGAGRVCLFSMFHIGEKQYYEGLKPLLEKADIILYESMIDADGKGEGTVREVDILEREIVELYTHLAGLHRQTLWEYPLMENDSRWKCIDLPKSQFYAYIDKHKVDLRPSVLRADLAELREQEQKGAGNLADVLRRRLLKDIMATTEETCCYAWLPKEERKIVHQFIHTKRDANFLSQVTQIAGENPDSTIAVILGARHVMPLKENLKAEHGYREISTCWFDAIKVHIGGTAQPDEEEKRL